MPERGLTDAEVGLGPGLSDADVGITPPRTSGERFSSNVEDAFARGPSMAVARAEGQILAENPSAASGFDPRAMGGIPDSLIPKVITDGLARIFTPAGERERRKQYEASSAADPFYRAPGGVVGKAIAGGATLGGQFGGSALDPSSWIAPGKTVVQRAGGAALVNTGADVVAQGADIGAKVQDDYDPLQTAASAGFGATLSLGSDAAAAAAKGVARKVRDARAAKETARIEAEIQRYAAAEAQPWTVEKLWGALEQQESGGKQSATSPVGARGVAQLMPETAQEVANAIGRPELAGVALANTPQSAWANRLLGQTYLKQQLDAFGNDPVLALAAYNAGPGAVKKWIDRFGTPEQVGRSRWVELIPFDETRGYVRKILGDAAGQPVKLEPPVLLERERFRKEIETAEAAIARQQEEARRVSDEEAAKAAAAQRTADQAAQEAEAGMARFSDELEQEIQAPEPKAEPVQVTPETLRDAGWTASEIREWQGGGLQDMAQQAAQGYAYHGDWQPFTPEIEAKQRADTEAEIAKLEERIARVQAQFQPGDTVPPQIGDARPAKFEDWMAEQQRYLAQWQERLAGVERNAQRYRAANPVEDDFPGDRPAGAGQIVDDPWDEAPEIVAPAERDLTDDALDLIRSGRNVREGEGPTLVEGLVNLGGVRDEGGELRDILGGAGSDRKWKMLRRVQNGRSLDDATLWAWEQGYIGTPGGDRPLTGELLEAIAREAQGNPSFARYSAEKSLLKERVDALQEMLDYLGIDPRGMSNAEIRAAMDDFMDSANRFDDEDLRSPDVLDDTVFGAKPTRSPDQGDMFAPDAGQASGQLRADMDKLLRDREARRQKGDLTEGGLFDETRRGEQDLFGQKAGGDSAYARAKAAGFRIRDMDAVLGSTRGGLREQPKARAIPAGEGDLPKVKAIRDIAKTLLKKLDLVRRQGRVGMAGALGTYNRKSGMIRTKGAHELDVVAHEIGHAVDMTKQFPELKAVMLKYDSLLKALDYDPTAQRAHEGWAEYFRWYITNPEFANQLAPGLYRDFEAAMAKDAPGDLLTMQEAQRDYQAFLNAPSLAAARAQVTAPPARGLGATIRSFKENGFSGSVQAFADEVYRGVFDQLNPWKKAVERLQRIYSRNHKGAVIELRAVDDAYKQLRSMPSVASAGHMDLMYGVHGYHELDPTSPAFADAMKLALGDKFFRWDKQGIEDFGTYLIARRASYLHGRAQAGLMDQPPDILSREFWDQTAADLELRNPTFADAAALIYEWNTALLEKQMKSGMLDRETFEEILSEQQDYVPLFRDVSDRDATGGMRGSGTERAGGVIRLKGSDRAYMNPIHSMMQRAYEVNAAIARNDAVKSLDTLGRLAGPDAGQIVERLPRTEQRGVRVDALDALEKAANEIGVSKADQLLVRQTLETLFGDEAVTTVYKAVDMTPRRGENVVWLWENGEKVPIQLPDGAWGRQMIETLSGMTPPMGNMLFELAAIPARMLRYGITAHPSFFIANWIRDQFTAAVLTDVGFIPGVDNIRGMGADFRKAGLARQYNVVQGHSGGQNVAAEQRARGERDVQALRTKGARLRHVASWQGLAHFTELSETGTRLGIFDRAMRKAKKEGMDDWAAAKEASFEARDYMDFERHGAFPGARAVVRLVPFFNAALQALDKTNRVAFGGAAGAINTIFGRAPLTAADKRKLEHAFKFWTVASVMAVGSGALRAAMADDPEWQEIQDYLRNTHWVVPLPDTEEYAVIPKPYDIAVLSNIFERAYEGMTLNDPTAPGRLAEGLRDIWLPPVDAPIAMLPLELARNKDSFGIDIVPEGKRDRLPQEQRSDRTSPLAVQFTEALRTLTGDKVNLSPAQVEHTAKGMGGTIARDVLRTGQKKAPIDAKASELPIISRFVKDWTRGPTSQKEFFKLVGTQDGKYTTTANSWGDLVREGNYAEATKRLAKMDPSMRAYVLTATFAQGQDKQSHPLIRATMAGRAIGELSKDLTENDVLTVDNGALVPLRLTPTQRRAAVDGLRKMAVAEQRNALIAAGVPGWAGVREPLPINVYQAEVNRAAPGVLEALSARLERDKVVPAEASYAQWAQVKTMLQRNPDPAWLTRMIDWKRATGSGAAERVLKTPVPVEPQAR